MPAVGETIVVDGIADLQRAFQLADRKVQKDLRDRLKGAAEPVRQDAERLVFAGISRIGFPWSRMRVGVTRYTVYVAPRERGARGSTRRRPKLANLMLPKMEQSLADNQAGVIREVDELLGDVGRVWENA